MQYILTIDSGNTNIKWGIFECGILVKNNRIHLQQANLLQAKFGDLPKPDFVIISHVASDQVKDAIVKSLSIWDVEVFWLHSSKKLCGVKNGYVNSQQLGSDRWASLIAAWHKIKQSCLIINAGTAVTVDALSDSGEHLGGIILPGIHLMHSSLTQNTQLPHNAIAGEFKSEFPLNTFDAIKTGIFFA